MIQSLIRIDFAESRNPETLKNYLGYSYGLAKVIKVGWSCNGFWPTFDGCKNELSRNKVSLWRGKVIAEEL